MEKVFYPSFYKDFVCLCGDCPDTCCAKWELPVDDESMAFYSSDENEFCKKVCKKIITDADGDNIFALENERCPFLDEKGLCEIRMNLGYEHTPEVCRQHPDFIEEYECFTEVCPSLSCPGALPLIMKAGRFSYPVNDSHPEDDYLKVLIKIRNGFLSGDYDCSSFEKASEYLIKTAFAEERKFADTYPYDDIVFSAEETDFTQSKQTDAAYFSDILRVLCSCEILTPEWEEILKKCSVCELDYNSCEGEHALLCYLVYRYLFKAVNGYSVSGLLFLLVHIVKFISAVSSLTGIPFAEIARLASKEVEHNPDNLILFAERFLY